MPLDPMLANPTTIKLDNPLETQGRVLQNAMMMEKFRAARRAEEQNALVNDTRKKYTNAQGDFDRQGYRYGAAQAGIGALQDDTDESWAKQDHLKAQATAQTALAGKNRADRIAKNLENASIFFLGATPDEAGLPQIRGGIDAVFKDPDLGEYFTEHNLTRDMMHTRLNNEIARGNIKGFLESWTLGLKGHAAQQMKRVEEAGRNTRNVDDNTQSNTNSVRAADTSTNNNIRTTDTSRQNNAATVGQSNVNNIRTTGVSTANSIRSTNQSNVNNLRTTDTSKANVAANNAFKEKPVDKRKNDRLVAEFKARAEAAAIIAPKIAEELGAQAVVMPGSADIKIYGVMPLSQRAQRILEKRAAELGGRLYVLDGDVPTIQMNTGSTAKGATGVTKPAGAGKLIANQDNVLVPAKPGVTPYRAEAKPPNFATAARAKFETLHKNSPFRGGTAAMKAELEQLEAEEENKWRRSKGKPVINIQGSSTKGQKPDGWTTEDWLRANEMTQKERLRQSQIDKNNRSNQGRAK